MMIEKLNYLAQIVLKLCNKNHGNTEGRPNGIYVFSFFLTLWYGMCALQREKSVGTRGEKTSSGTNDSATVTSTVPSQNVGHAHNKPGVFFEAPGPVLNSTDCRTGFSALKSTPLASP